jgi:hypothetical protein
MICNKCGIDKEPDCFYSCTWKNGYKYTKRICKDCINLDSLKYRRSHGVNPRPPIIIDGKKYCHKCKTWKTIDSFWKSTSNKTGIDSACRECSLKANAEYLSDPQTRAKHNAYRRSYYAQRQKEGPEYRIEKNLRTRIYCALHQQRTNKNSHLLDLVGCGLDELKAYIEAQFLPGMTWDNYAIDTWHIDHIKACSTFDLTKEEEQKKCFNYTNLQPLWAIDNIKKGNK